MRLENSELPREKNHLGCLLTGMQDDEPWHSKRMADFYDLKGCAENILADLKIRRVKTRSDMREPFLHPGKSSAIMVGGKYAGFIGEVHHNVMDALDLKNAVFVMEIDTDILAEAFSGQISYREISRYPSITRDVALLVGRSRSMRIGCLALLMSPVKNCLKKCVFLMYMRGKVFPTACEV